MSEDDRLKTRQLSMSCLFHQLVGPCFPFWGSCLPWHFESSTSFPWCWPASVLTSCLYPLSTVTWASGIFLQKKREQAAVFWQTSQALRKIPQNTLTFSCSILLLTAQMGQKMILYLVSPRNFHKQDSPFFSGSGVRCGLKGVGIARGGNIWVWRW